MRECNIFQADKKTGKNRHYGYADKCWNHLPSNRLSPVPFAQWVVKVSVIFKKI